MEASKIVDRAMCLKWASDRMVALKVWTLEICTTKFCYSATVPACNSPIWDTEHQLSRDRHVVYMSLGWPLLSLLPSKWGETQILNDWHWRIQRIHLSPFGSVGHVLILLIEQFHTGNSLLFKPQHSRFLEFCSLTQVIIIRLVQNGIRLVQNGNHEFFNVGNSVVLNASQWDNWLSTLWTKDDRRETSWAGNGHVESNVCWFIWSNWPFVSNQIYIGVLDQDNLMDYHCFGSITRNNPG